ncbi:helix-turn-helix transcriptional regulator [Paraclostridium sordellii]|uniref:HTH-type transcriptional regulator n=1 Tax=Paraclostridium sordellii TaxID=1505 RepID=A0A0C7LJ84_PARSO|nr:helix-turn-helix transcriptional regulator [Paeniclostridium sordellii]QYE99767.1 helix-turn-helix transcriptional regulator [Paeniclostridium sordellii]CEN21125.1 HTH-type transcriptional regulator [[Clostridium] sordellii] [Paeniclostridium sordellii]CEN21934.1 HTH-type transcriptional regulator [[Clostridium] sordellii] [Paeniclostridium sordellii]CEN30871.1 HTH-type transcriptional regulator [[Clostridium] sordellii] [Paeniclostridium sordellii]CEP40407.1 HTH-type transcriptional regula
MTKFVSNLKKYRLFNELTQEELAMKVNVRRETIARLENAKYNPSLELAVRISKELNTPIEKLFIFQF